MRNLLSGIVFLISSLCFSQSGLKWELEYPSQSKPSSVKPATIYQKIDSTYSWSYNINMLKWNVAPQGKNTNYIYDANYNLLGSIHQGYSGGWYPNGKTENSYDASNNMTLSVNSYSYGWSTNWELGGKRDYTYNSANKMLCLLATSWDGSIWDSSFRYTYTYDIQQNLTSFLKEKYSNNAWAGEWRTSYTYDMNNNMTSSDSESFTNSVWEKVQKYIIAFNSFNAITSRTYQVGSGNMWENQYRATYTLDANNNPVNAVGDSWVSNTWTINSKTSFTYSGNNQSGCTSQIWNGSSWENAGKVLYVYNASNKELSRTYMNWSLTAATWVNSFRELRTYDANDNQTSYVAHSWQSNTWKRQDVSTRKKWDNNNFNHSSSWFYYDPTNPGVLNYGDSSVIYYKTVVGLKENNNKTSELTIHPNPSNGHFTLNTKENTGEIEVYNLVGTKVYQGKIDGTTTYLNLSALPKGIYILMVSQGKTRQNLKIVIE